VSAAVVAGHFLPVLDNTEIENGIRNSLHIVVFAIFAILVFRSLDRLGTFAAITATLLVIAVVGSVSEFMQYLVGKRPDPIDIARDLSGAALGVLGWLLWRWSNVDNASELSRTVRRASSISTGTIIVVPFLYWLTVIVLSRSVFPTILSFDNWWDAHLYSPINAEIFIPAVVADTPAAIGAVAEIHLSKRGRSGLSVLPMVSNWTAYEYLTFFAAMVRGPDTTVTVRINDGSRIHHFSNHFMARIVVTDEMALFRIPLKEITTESGLRTMDLSDIQEIVIFARDRRKGTVMLLDEIRLE
jgi:hypothetical protein